MVQVNRALLTPRWLALHVLFLAATTATGFLAWWQWERAHEAGGGAQNLGYALMWPLFGVFTLFLWLRLARLEPRPDAPPAEEPESEPPAAANRRRPLVPPSAPPVDAEEDPELAAYNQYLRELNQLDQRR